MLKVQIKQIDFTSWAITLPPENAKGGATTDHAETVYAMTPRVRQMLEARRDQLNNPERYVFGAESGAYVASFDKSWREIFRHAGLPVGRLQPPSSGNSTCDQRSRASSSSSRKRVLKRCLSRATRSHFDPFRATS